MSNPSALVKTGLTKNKKKIMIIIGAIFLLIGIPLVSGFIIYSKYYKEESSSKTNYFINGNNKKDIEDANNSEPIVVDDEKDNDDQINKNYTPPNPIIDGNLIPPDMRSISIGLGIGVSSIISGIIVKKGVTMFITDVYAKQVLAASTKTVAEISKEITILMTDKFSTKLGANMSKFLATRFTSSATASAATIGGGIAASTVALGSIKISRTAIWAAMVAYYTGLKMSLASLKAGGVTGAFKGATAAIYANPITFFLFIFMVATIAIDIADPHKLSSTASRFQMIMMRDQLLNDFEENIVGPFDNWTTDEFSTKINEKMNSLLLIPNNKYIFEITKNMYEYINSTEELKIKYLEFRTLLFNLTNKNETEVNAYLEANKGPGGNTEKINNYINRILFGQSNPNDINSVPDPLQLPLDVINNMMGNMYVLLSIDSFSELCVSNNGFIIDGQCSYNKTNCRSHYDWPKVKESLDITTQMGEYVGENGVVDEENPKYKELKDKLDKLSIEYDINYSEWSNGEWVNGVWVPGKCTNGLLQMRNFCNDSGALYNETEKICVIDEKYCKKKVLNWEFNNNIDFRVENNCLNTCKGPIKDKFEEIDRECSKKIIITNTNTDATFNTSFNKQKTIKIKDKTSPEYLNQFKEYFDCKKSALNKELTEHPNELFKKCTEDCKYDCILPAGQMVTEALFGMTLSRSVENDANITNYEKCKKGEVDTGRTCQYCGSGKVLKNGLCYNQCPVGYYQNGPICWQQCPKIPFPKPTIDNPNITKDIRLYDMGVSCNKHNYPIVLTNNKCINGYTNNAGFCWSNCPDGMRDDGAFCAKNTKEIGIGTVPDTREKKKLVGFGDTDQKQRICPEVPVELPDFELDGICWTSSASVDNKCPNGIWNLDGICWNTYNYLEGDKNNSCGENKEYINGLCYPKCKDGYTRIEGQSPDGCFKNCPDGYSRGINLNNCYKNCPNPTYDQQALDCIGGCSAINKTTKQIINYPDEETSQAILERLKEINSICYGDCPPGYTSPSDIDLICYENCPNGDNGKPLKDDGLLCRPNLTDSIGYVPYTYGRGAGTLKERTCNDAGYTFNGGVCWEETPCKHYRRTKYDNGFCRNPNDWFDYEAYIIKSNTNITDKCPSGKEECGGLCYDSCQSGYSPSGCNLCRQQCPGEEIAGLCYNSCPEGYHRTAPTVCVQNNSYNDQVITKKSFGKTTTPIQSFQRHAVDAPFTTDACVDNINGNSCEEL